MIGSTIVVLTAQRQTRRQISRALRAGAIEPVFVETPAETLAALEHRCDLLIVDCDSSEEQAIESMLSQLMAMGSHPPLILLSLRAEKEALLSLIESHDIGNLVAKHGAIRAAYPVLDERELLVTCEKVIRRNIFGIDKYVGSWGVVLRRATVTSVADKTPCLTRFEEYLTQLDCPPSIIPGIVTVAEELILNAVIHAPHTKDGRPKYEHIGPQEDIKLAPDEYVDVVYGCDGQRLMLSVTDRFGRLNKKTLYNYLSRGFGAMMEPEIKPSGAGLGLSLSFRSIHQLIFNIQDGVRTEVIAGWYLRVATATEFRQVAKSFNLFWLPAFDAPASVASPEPPQAIMLKGRLDESTDFSSAAQATVLDLRHVTSITSRGLLQWLKFIRSMHGRRLEIRACPEPIVRLATEVAGVLQGVEVTSVLVPIECMACGHEEAVERGLGEVFAPIAERCGECGDSLRFAGVSEQYESFVSHFSRAAV